MRDGHGATQRQYDATVPTASPSRSVTVRGASRRPSCDSPGGRLVTLVLTGMMKRTAHAIHATASVCVRVGVRLQSGGSWSEGTTPLPVLLSSAPAHRKASAKTSDSCIAPNYWSMRGKRLVLNPTQRYCTRGEHVGTQGPQSRRRDTTTLTSSSTLLYKESSSEDSWIHTILQVRDNTQSPHAIMMS